MKLNCQMFVPGRPRKGGVAGDKIERKKMMEEIKTYCGECIFCNSKCPECGSTRISVKFDTKNEYENDWEDTIKVYQHVEVTGLKCDHCDLDIDKEWDFPDEEELKLLEPLETALNKHYADMVEFTHNNETRAIEKQEFDIESRRKGA